MNSKFRTVLSVTLLYLSLIFTDRSTAEDNVPAVPAGGEYAGSESCKDCHESSWDHYKGSPHGNDKHPRSPASRHGCETCHGPRGDHVQVHQTNGDVPGDDITADVPPAVCFDCHNKSKTVMWPGSVHERREVTCSNCHDAHGSRKNLLNAETEIELCSTCHKDVRSQLLRSSHHPIREGKMECSDCHNPHGTVDKSLIDAQTLNDKCYECHAEKRGPFLWEHAPVVEDCSNCHRPHGSNHNYLLTWRMPFLCQQCHSNSRHPGTLYAQDANRFNTVYTDLNNRGFYRNCMNCHSQVHGSNHPSGRSLAR